MISFHPKFDPFNFQYDNNGAIQGRMAKSVDVLTTNIGIDNYLLSFILGIKTSYLEGYIALSGRSVCHCTYISGRCPWFDDTLGL